MQHHPANRARGAPVLGLLAAALLSAAALTALSAGCRNDRVVPASASRPSGAAEQTAALVEAATLPYGSDEQWSSLDDPHRDGWNTEVVASAADKQWKKLAEWLRQTDSVSAQQLAALADADFRCGPLSPRSTRLTYRDQVFEVRRRVADDDQQEADSDAEFRGVEGLRKALEQIVGGRRDGVQFAAKITRVLIEGEEAVTEQLVALSGRERPASGPAASAEVHAAWRARWRLSRSGAAAKLLTIDLLDWAETVSGGSTPLFADCTHSVLGANDCYQQQFLLGMNHWFEITQDTRYNALLGTPGLAVGDVDGDGLDDLYVCQESGLPNRLFIQRADGTARDESAAWGVDWLDNSRSALLADLDNDGDQDLVVATVGCLIVSCNEGRQFSQRAVLAVDDDTMSLCAADYDNDGDLDLYVCVNMENDTLGRKRRPAVADMASDVYFDSTTGGRNSLLRNDIAAPDTWAFSDVTEQVGLDANNRRVSYAAAWEDFDNDGDQDLYVANDFGPNNLFRNELTTAGEPRFVDIAEQAGAEDRASGMSAAWGDTDADGAMDLYVGNMFSSAGQRITSQPQFKPESPQVRAYLQRFARGNTLLRNSGNGAFEDLSDSAAVTLGRWSWSSNFCDINNDGWPDLMVANGYITTDDTGDL